MGGGGDDGSDNSSDTSASSEGGDGADKRIGNYLNDVRLPYAVFRELGHQERAELHTIIVRGARQYAFDILYLTKYTTNTASDAFRRTRQHVRALVPVALRHHPWVLETVSRACRTAVQQALRNESGIGLLRDAAEGPFHHNNCLMDGIEPENAITKAVRWIAPRTCTILSWWNSHTNAKAVLSINYAVAFAAGLYLIKKRCYKVTAIVGLVSLVTHALTRVGIRPVLLPKA
jgi:hypothetical protein